MEDTLHKMDGKVTDELKSSLQGTTAEVVTPGDAEYEDLIMRWSEAAVKRAGAVVLPKDAIDVVATVKLARERKIPFVVAGGRHSTGAASSVEDGIVLDLRRMRSVSVDPEKKTITAQGGCNWQDVDEAAAKHGLATVGGTVNHTGIGGLTLGGGYGWLSGQYGLTADVLLSVKIVLADGSLVTASEKENPDLFWAIRGCGSAFGVVTEFVFQGFDQGPVWAGTLIFTPEELVDVVRFANKFDKENDGTQAMSFGFSAPPPQGLPVVLSVVFFNGPAEEAEKFYADLLALKPLMNTTQVMPYEQLNSIMNPVATFGGRKTGGASAVKCDLDPTVIQSVFDEFSAFITETEGANESVILFEFIPYKKIVKVPFEATAHGNRGEYYNVGTVFRWYNAELDGKMRAFSRQLHQKIRENGGTSVLKGVGAYSNYVDYPSIPEKVFGANTPRLIEVKKKYDPQNLFFRWHNLLPEGVWA